MTPLFEACTNGDAPLVDLILKAGANPNTRIATGVPPIMSCARSGSADAVKILLGRGADVNANDSAQNQTALMWAAAEHHPDVVQILIQARPALFPQTKGESTPLPLAARKGDVESPRLPPAAGVDINIRSQADAPPPAGDGDQTIPLAGRRAAS